jgi:hypothetical protein
VLQSQLSTSSTLVGHALSWSIDVVVSHFGNVRGGVVSIGLDIQKRQQHAGRCKARFIPARREGTFVSHVLVLFMKKERLACRERTIHPQGRKALSFAPSFSRHRHRSFLLSLPPLPSRRIVPSISSLPITPSFPSHRTFLLSGSKFRSRWPSFCTASAVFNVYRVIVLIM